jgi:hypothetical protein
MATDNRAMPGPFSGLSVKLIATIVAVILAVEVVIYLPSAANFSRIASASGSSPCACSMQCPTS